MDYKKVKAPTNTITRDMNSLSEPVGNIYETVRIIGKRSNQIAADVKRELDKKLQITYIPITLLAIDVLATFIKHSLPNSSTLIIILSCIYLTANL